MTNATLSDLIRTEYEFYSTDVTPADIAAYNPLIESTEISYHFVTGKHAEGKQPRKISRPAKSSRKAMQWKLPSMAEMEMVAVATLQVDPWGEMATTTTNTTTTTTNTTNTTTTTIQLALTAAPTIDGFDTIEDGEDLPATETWDWVPMVVALIRLVWSIGVVAVNVGEWVLMHPSTRSAAVLVLTGLVWVCQVVPMAAAAIGSVVLAWVKIQVTAQMGGYKFWQEYDREVVDMVAAYTGMLETYTPTRYQR